MVNKRLRHWLIIGSIAVWLGLAGGGILLTRIQPSTITEILAYSLVVPILAAAFFYGRHGGQGAALIASLFSASLVVGQPMLLEVPIVQRMFFQIFFFNAIALMMGSLVEAERKARTPLKVIQDSAHMGGMLIETEQALKESEDKMQSLMHLTRQLELARSYYQIVAPLQKEIQQIIGYRSASIYLLDENKEYARLLANAGEKADAVKNNGKVFKIKGDAYLEEVVAADKVIIVEDARCDPRTNKALVEQHGNRTIVNIPVLLENEQLGSITTGTFGDEGIRIPSQVELDYLEAISRHIAVVVDRIRFQEERAQTQEALFAANEEWERTFNAIPDYICILDMTGAILRANKAMQERFEPIHGNLTGLDYRLIYMGTVTPDPQPPCAAVLSGSPPVTVESQLPTMKGWQLVSSFPIYNKDKNQIGAVSVVRDITRRKEAERKIHQHLQRLQALHRIDLAITTNTDLDIVLDTIITNALSQLKVDAAAILLYDAQTLDLAYASGQGFRTEVLQHTYLALGKGYAGRAASERRIIQLNNLQDGSTKFMRSPHFQDEGFESYISAPLIAKGEIIGVLEIFHRAPLNPNTEWLDFLETLATQAAIGIENASLFDGMQHANQELHEAYRATLEGWAHALELRDQETLGHTRRVVQLTLRLAHALGIPENELEHIQHGALVHDLGKMAIPDNILLKPGPLSPEEKAIMHQHPGYAYSILSEIAYLRPALDIPYCHHEKWDGSGYPRGLKGDEIPLAARIFAVADVWDALTSDRPYRTAWSREETLAHIREQSGKHFDPQVVEALLRILE